MTDCDQPQAQAPGCFKCPTPASMRALGVALGRCLEPGDVVFLTGDLGAGKTCLTGGVAQGLGDAGPVTSPTFQIMCVHDAGRIPLYHFDLYRLEDAGQLEDIGLFDVLEGDGACLIEWAELFAEELGDEHLEVRVTRDAAADPGAEPPRLVSVAGFGTRPCELARALEAQVGALAEVEA